MDFGFGHGPARYVDGDLPVADGFVLIKEVPPPQTLSSSSSSEVDGDGGLGSKGSWTDNGVDVTVSLKAEDMERLLGDEFLLPMLNY